MPFQFHVDHTDGPARAGTLNTAHGPVLTPAFIPVATQGSVKAVAPDDLTSLGAGILLSNTYHLMLRPGVRLVSDMGGLHSFMSWHGPILTDSGGFQTFSLGRLNRISEEGATFRSHVDGSERFLSPEMSIECQALLGADIAMVLDQCTPYGLEEAQVRQAMSRTHRWALRCKEEHRQEGQALFAVVQGGVSRRPAAGVRLHAGSYGLSRIRGWRAERGRAEGPDVRDSFPHGGGPAPRQAKIPHGGGFSGRPG